MASAAELEIEQEKSGIVWGLITAVQDGVGFRRTPLHNLAVYRGTEAAYGERLYRLRATYSRRSGLRRRLDGAGLEFGGNGRAGDIC